MVLGALVLLVLLVWFVSRAPRAEPEGGARPRNGRSRRASTAPISMSNLRRSFVRRYGR